MSRDIWDELRSMQSRMDSLFDSMRGGGFTGKQGYQSPRSDIWETESSVMAEIELPGVNKDDINLKVTEDSIELQAESKSEVKQEEEGMYRLERSSSGYYRKFALPRKVDASKADAEYKNGLLKIKVPKQEKDNDGGVEVKVK